MSKYWDNPENINENNLNSATPIESEGYKKPTSLLSALSVIQRYYVIEQNSVEDLPEDYFTFEQIVDFVKVGFKNGFIESLLFITLLPFFQTIYPSFKFYFLGETLTSIEKFVLEFISFLPMIISTLFLIYLAKYYKGSVTKRAIFSLFFGRSIAFLLKSVLAFFLLKYLYEISYIYPEKVYGVLDFFKFIFGFFLPYDINLDVIYQYYYKFIAPAIKQTSREMLITMVFFALLPFITIFLKGLMLKAKKTKALQEYEKY